MTLSTTFQRLFVTMHLVNPDSTILTPKDGLGWHKLLVNLAPSFFSVSLVLVILVLKVKLNENALATS